MKNLASLLERFKRSLGKSTVDKDSIISIIKSTASIELSHADISVKEHTLEISSTPSKNNEIRLKADAIINSLNTNTSLRIQRIFFK